MDLFQDTRKKKTKIKWRHEQNILKTSEHLKTRLDFRKYFELLASFTGNNFGQKWLDMIEMFSRRVFLWRSGSRAPPWARFEPLQNICPEVTSGHSSHWELAEGGMSDWAGALLIDLSAGRVSTLEMGREAPGRADDRPPGLLSNYSSKWARRAARLGWAHQGDDGRRGGGWEMESEGGRGYE